MEKSKTSNRYSPTARQRMLHAREGEIGCIPETLRVWVWVRQAERDSGTRDGVGSAERDRIKELEREARQLWQANEILRKGEPVKLSFTARQVIAGNHREGVQAHWRARILRSMCERAATGTRPLVQAMIGFIR